MSIGGVKESEGNHKNEVMGLWNLKVIEVVKSMWCRLEGTGQRGNKTESILYMEICLVGE